MDIIIYTTIIFMNINGFISFYIIYNNLLNFSKVLILLSSNILLFYFNLIYILLFINLFSNTAVITSSKIVDTKNSGNTIHINNNYQNLWQQPIILWLLLLGHVSFSRIELWLFQLITIDITIYYY